MKKSASTFENDLHEEMKVQGLLFPISDEEIERFESKFTKVPLPDKLKNAEQILLRNKDKIQTTVQPVLQVAALFDTTEPVMNSRAKKPKKKTSKKK